MDALPQLNKAQLRSVASFAQQLCEEGKTAPRQRNRGGGGKKEGTPPKSTPGKPKGPAKQVSPHEAMPEYQTFRAADRALKALLKEEKTDLKTLSALTTTLNPSKMEILNKFHESREAYFRAKTALPTSTNSASSSSTPKTPPISGGNPVKPESKAD